MTVTPHGPGRIEALSAPNLSLVSPQLAGIVFWRVLEYKYDSDHFLILIKLNSRLSNKFICRPYYTISKVD